MTTDKNKRTAAAALARLKPHKDADNRSQTFSFHPDILQGSVGLGDLRVDRSNAKKPCPTASTRKNTRPDNADSQ